MAQCQRGDHEKRSSAQTMRMSGSLRDGENTVIFGGIESDAFRTPRPGNFWRYSRDANHCNPDVRTPDDWVDINHANTSARFEHLIARLSNPPDKRNTASAILDFSVRK